MNQFSDERDAMEFVVGEIVKEWSNAIERLSEGDHCEPE
jgi:hypothetical protein